MDFADYESIGEINGFIHTPGEHDVLFGRGGAINSHEGNIMFRRVVNEEKEAYFRANKTDKPKIAYRVVEIIRNLDPPGRFLAPVNETDKNYKKDGRILWYDVGTKKARAKASQCLRERARFEQEWGDRKDSIDKKVLFSDPSTTAINSPNGNRSYESPIPSISVIPDSFRHDVAAKKLNPRGNLHFSYPSNWTNDNHNHKYYSAQYERPPSRMPVPKQSYYTPNFRRDEHFHTSQMSCKNNVSANSIGGSNDTVESIDQITSYNSWIGSFCSLESHLIDTSMTFSSPGEETGTIDFSHQEKFAPVAPVYVCSSSSTMSELTYQSEHEM